MIEKGNETNVNQQDLGWAHCWIPTAQHTTAATLLLLHGTGGDENDMVSLGKTLWPGANILSPRGRVRENGMPRFFRRLNIGIFDEEDLKAQTHALADFVASAAQVYGFDATRMVAVGFSNGANIAASLLMLSPATLSGAILLRAMVPLELTEKSDLSSVKVLLASGEYDPMVPVENARQLISMLRERGAEVTHEWQNAGHNLSSDDIAATREWLSANFPA